MDKLALLIVAMSIHEGWKPLNSDTGYAGSASYRRHNPLNLRASPFAVGSDHGFCVFRNDADGMAAARWDIVQKAKGNTQTGLGPNSTIADLIRIWAPAADNNDENAYLQAVLTMTGFSPTMSLEALISL